MNISLDELDVDIVQSTPDNEDAYDGRWGWYWHEIHERPRGPFADPATALHDLADWVQQHVVDPPAPLQGDAALAPLFLRNAAGFLDGADCGSGEVQLAACCYALELILKAYLLSRGFADAWNAEHLRHDLDRAYRLASHHGLPDDDARIDQFIAAVNADFQRHALMALHAARADLVARFEAVSALRALHRETVRRVEGMWRVRRTAGPTG
ncbi:MAG: hypothetical protein JNK30_12635 [Phenylobacterium sp.]|uniref:hypothetical protein n=1 Tax=Phenylobacterium sp. TaxID=1871053 RepID=UPI001A44DBC1|nr:hypothetical protein [Phenylobacterium sp.]MBL8772220.1 hypothetical protein [Phenylobacterium sp.]